MDGGRGQRKPGQRRSRMGQKWNVRPADKLELTPPLSCVVEIWQRVVKGGAALTPGVSEPRREAEEWVMVERRIPLRVGETAAAIELRQSGENSVLGSLATSLSTSLSHLLRWSYSTGGIQPSRGPMM